MFKQILTIIAFGLAVSNSRAQAGMACDCWNRLEEANYQWNAKLLVDFYMADASKCDNRTDSVLSYYEALSRFSIEKGDILYAGFMDNPDFTASRKKYYEKRRIGPDDYDALSKAKKKFLRGVQQTARMCYDKYHVQINVCEPLAEAIEEEGFQPDETIISQWLVTQHKCYLSEDQRSVLSNLINSVGKEKIVEKLVLNGTSEKEVKDFYLMFNEEYDPQEAYESFVDLRMKSLSH